MDETDMCSKHRGIRSFDPIRQIEYGKIKNNGGESMQTKLTTGERLTDLRREHNLTLEQVSEQTGIVKSTLSNYENDKKPDINLGALEKLAALYGVGLDYLLGLTENKKHSGTSLADLHLSDDAVDVLSSGKVNNRLLSELIAHPEFARLMADMEIYVDGIVSMQIRNLNSLLESARTAILEKYHPEEDNTLLTLKAAQIDEDEYFARVVSDDVERILKDLKQAHSGDQGSAAADDAASLKEYIESISETEGSDFQKWIMIFCKQIHLPYNKLTDTEKQWLIQISRKSSLLKSGTSQRGKHPRK
ncbi:hypothetical protein B5E67_09080 [Faecalibacterium sp. An122]|nr:hypothetical protein B5E67_09080 [Faecalibacterium sp. An122]